MTSGHPDFPIKCALKHASALIVHYEQYTVYSHVQYNNFFTLFSEFIRAVIFSIIPCPSKPVHNGTVNKLYKIIYTYVDTVGAVKFSE